MSKTSPELYMIPVRPVSLHLTILSLILYHQQLELFLRNKPNVKTIFWPGTSHFSSACFLPASKSPTQCASLWTLFEQVAGVSGCRDRVLVIEVLVLVVLSCIVMHKLTCSDLKTIKFVNTWPVYTSTLKYRHTSHLFQVVDLLSVRPSVVY